MLNQLISFWEKQNISIHRKTKKEIDVIQLYNQLMLPNDFIEFFSTVNGMQDFFPNETDEGGFLFYPLEAVTSMSTEFGDSKLVQKDRIFLFAEYLHKSWWYGFEVTNNGDYVIGIIPDIDSFKPIANSLADFIKLYIKDASELYDYS